MFSKGEKNSAQWQKWMDDPSDAGCKGSPSALTLENPFQARWNVKWGRPEPGYKLEPDTASSVLRPESIGLTGVSDNLPEAVAEIGLPSAQVYKWLVLAKDHNNYVILFGPGCIFARAGYRKNRPNCSEIALVVYRHFETEDLGYVFQANVVNEDNKDLVKRMCERNGFKYRSRGARVWKYGTSHYRAIWATPNARGVAGLVLGGLCVALNISQKFGPSSIPQT